MAEMFTPTAEDYLKSNPRWTHAQAVGYISGKEAALAADQFAGLSAGDWIHAGDDFARGYRQGYRNTAGLSACADL